MRFNRCLRYIFLVIFIFIFKIDSVNAVSDVTCKYQMYPVGYYVKNGEVYPGKYRAKAKNTALLEYKYTASTDKYIIEHKNSITDIGNNKVKDSSFNKSVKQSGKCPNYIYATGKKVDEIDGTELVKKVDKLYDGNPNGYKYPMVLVEQNGEKKTTPTTFLLNHVMNNWAKLIDGGSLNKEYTEEANILKQQILASDIGKNVSGSLSNWGKFSDFVTKSVNGESALKNEKKLEEIQKKIKTINSDYCSLYCSETHCKKQTNSTAKTQCENTCNSSFKPKCDNAYNSCKNISSSIDKKNCIQNALTAAGLDASYTADREKIVSKLRNQERELKKAVSKAQVSPIKITIGEGYKVKCEDVSMLHDLWVIIIIVAPGIVIVLGTFDFLKAIIAGDEQKMKKAWKNFPKRLLALVFLILVPQLISIVLSISNDETASDPGLMYCIINGGDK